MLKNHTLHFVFFSIKYSRDTPLRSYHFHLKEGKTKNLVVAKSNFEILQLAFNETDNGEDVVEAKLVVIPGTMNAEAKKPCALNFFLVRIQPFLP